MFKEFSDAGQLVVFDLEWNQSSYTPNLRMPHEIIEIGACKVGADGKLLDTFSRIIKPRLYKKLDKHIRQVTGITDEELSQGGNFSDVFGDFIVWCGDTVQLVTWGRDDFPVLRRNAAFFMTPMPFDPPIDAQSVFGAAHLGDPNRQMNLHAAMEEMQINTDVPAHRAVYDAICTASLLPSIDEMVEGMSDEMRVRLSRTMEKEARIATSNLRSLPTKYIYQTDALADPSLMSAACPVCGGETEFETPWFDNGRDKYLSVLTCRQHGNICGQMHFKRGPSDRLVMHQRTFRASAEDVKDIHRQYETYKLTPPKKRHHRLDMTEVQEKHRSRDEKTE